MTVKVRFVRKYWCFGHNFKQKNIFLPETENLTFGNFQGYPSLPKVAFLPLQASKLSNFKTSSISKQFSVTKIQIFSFREEKCSSVWSYDKNISIFWQKRTFNRQLLFEISSRMFISDPNGAKIVKCLRFFKWSSINLKSCLKIQL